MSSRCSLTSSLTRCGHVYVCVCTRAYVRACTLAGGKKTVPGKFLLPGDITEQQRRQRVQTALAPRAAIRLHAYESPHVYLFYLHSPIAIRLHAYESPIHRPSYSYTQALFTGLDMLYCLSQYSKYSMGYTVGDAMYVCIYIYVYIYMYTHT